MQKILKLAEFLLLVILFLAGFKFASAHFLQTSGSADVLMHIDPNDAPEAGKEADILFEITDHGGRFNPQGCNCQVVISQAGKVLLDSSPQIVTGNSVYALSQNFTFSKAGLYEISLTAIPTEEDTFNEFKVSYDMPVASAGQGFAAAAAQHQHGSPILEYSVAGAAFLFILYLIIKEKIKLRKLTIK